MSPDGKMHPPPCRVGLMTKKKVEQTAQAYANGLLRQLSRRFG
jgi:hypothetical protein